MSGKLSLQGLSRRSYALGLTLLLHLVLVYVATIKSVLPTPPLLAESPIHYINVSPSSSPPEFRISLPDINATAVVKMADVSQVDRLAIDADTEADAATEIGVTGEPYEFPNKNANQYQHLFDPRLRDRLQNLKHFTKSKTRTLEDIQILDLGGGQCEYTWVSSSKEGPPSVSIRVKCGNNESEQMIENMEKALQDPLNLR